jgi:hypothetical protein
MCNCFHRVDLPRSSIFPACCWYIAAAVPPPSKTRLDRCTMFHPQSLDLGDGTAVPAHCAEQADALCSIMKRVGSQDAFRVVRGHMRQVVSLPGLPYVKLLRPWGTRQYAACDDLSCLPQRAHNESVVSRRQCRAQRDAHVGCYQSSTFQPFSRLKAKKPCYKSWRGVTRSVTQQPSSALQPTLAC